MSARQNDQPIAEAVEAKVRAGAPVTDFTADEIAAYNRWNAKTQPPPHSHVTPAKDDTGSADDAG